MEKVMTVDPGFANHRKIEAILGETGTNIFNNEIAKIPVSTPDWRKEVVIDHIYTRVMLDFCKVVGVKTLEESLLDRNGHLFCSIVKTRRCKDVYDSDRATIECEPFEGSDLDVELHLTTSRIRGSTLKWKLHEGGEFAVIGQFSQLNEGTLVYEPLVIGLPYLADAETGNLLWERNTDFFHLHLEQFDEFAKLRDFDIPDTFDVMKNIKEPVFKACLGKILSESTPKDWGGETSDFYTSHLHIDGKRVPAAFALKGPAKFSPMNLSHLGKNSDQIVCLSKEPAEILIIQHCHDILPVVEETLKVFATQPSNPRRYCLIDGRESLRLLNAYNLTEWALNESKR